MGSILREKTPRRAATLAITSLLSFLLGVAGAHAAAVPVLGYQSE